MNVSELFDLTHWITSEIVENQLSQKYDVLNGILHQHAQPHQNRQSFETEKTDLINALQHVPLYQLTKDQLNFLHELGIGQAVGIEGVNQIEDILFKNVIDVATSAQKLAQIQQKLQNGIQKSDQIKTGLTDCVTKEAYETDNEILMRVSFTGNSQMSNVVDFKSWGNTWHEIGRGIAMAHNAAPEDVRIVGATKGSIVIELAVIASIATTASWIILAALKVAEKVLDIRKKAEEIKNLQLKNKAIVAEIIKEADNEKAAGIKKITSDIVKSLKIKKGGESDKITALDKAVQNLVNFIESGGEVDFVIPDEAREDESEASPDFGNLKITFQEIRQLETKIKLIESSNTEQAD